MRRSTWNSSRGLAVLATVAALLFAGIASWRATAADGKDAAAVELTEKVDVDVPSYLRKAGDVYYVDVTVENTSSEALAGPVVLVVEKTNIDELAVRHADATLEEGEAAFELIDRNGELAPKKKTAEQRLVFEPADPDSLPTVQQRRQFKLKYRVTRQHLPEEPNADVSRPRSAAGKAMPRGRGRSTQGSGNGRGSSGRSDRSESDDSEDEDAPAEEEDEESDEFEFPDAERFQTPEGRREVQRVIRIQNGVTQDFIKKEGVHGTATGLNYDGEVVIRAYVENHGIADKLPMQVQGVPVEIKVMQKIQPLYQQTQQPQPPPFPPPKRGQAGVPGTRPELDDPQQRFPRPVPVGISAFNQDDPVGCATGTLGCRLIGEDGTLYAFSNNHVFARESGNLFTGAAVGGAELGEDQIVQPGCLDLGQMTDTGQTVFPPGAVNPRPDDVIGTLAAFVPLQFVGTVAGLTTAMENRVDAAIAETTADWVSRSTADGAYGAPRQRTKEAFLGMRLQKLGRTTGYTTGRVTALNVNILVGYGPGLGFFVDQIEVTNPVRPDPITGVPSSGIVGGPGDSGSLYVTNPGRFPVGVLFAGTTDQMTAFANPIDDVLDELSAQVGQRVEVDGETLK